MKKFYFAVFIVILCGFTYKVNALSSGKITSVELNVRNEANDKSSVLDTYRYGTVVTLSSTDKIEGSGCADGWYKINYGTSNAYVCSTYVEIVNDNVVYSNTTYSTLKFDARLITSVSIPIKKSPSSSSGTYEYVISGTSFDIISSSAKGSGCSDEWYKVRYYGAKEGYICGTYIMKYSDMTLIKDEYTEEENTYIKLLKDKGFPDSYIPYLLKLHETYPQWNFEVSKNNLKFSSVVSGESGFNLIQNTITNYITNNIQREVGGWYTSTDGVNAFYLDPRNFLNKYFIFMFEQLSFNENSHTLANISSLFSSVGSYLASDEFSGYFINAGKTNNISPFNLASRSIQEGTAKETNAMISGAYTRTYRGYSLKGYYNYFNIGSYADDFTSEPGDRGLAFACGKACGFSDTYNRPWNTREKAIIGGSEFLKKNYYNNGQDTIYFQKFNTKVTPFYRNQYMTNVQAPSSEARSVYYVYNQNNMLNNSYTFIIPVYEDMPQFVSLPVMGSSNNYLSSIKVNGININSFDKNVLEYITFVDYDTSVLKIEPLAEDSKSAIEKIDNIDFDNEEKTVEIVVRAENGEERTYKLTIKRTKGSVTLEDIFSKLAVKTNGQTITNISPSTIASELINSINKQDPSAIIEYTSSNGEGKEANADLCTGDKIKITSSSNETNTYEIVVNGDTNGDGKVTILDLLRVQKHLVSSSKLQGSFETSADTNYDLKVDIVDLLRVQKYILGNIKL